MPAPDAFLSQFPVVQAPPQAVPGQAPIQAAPPADLAIPPNADVDPANANLHGEDYLKTLSPGYASQVKMFAEGKAPLPAGFALKSGYFQKVLRDITQYDPEFDAANFNARNALRKDYLGGGKRYTELQAVNTVAGHLQNLMKAADSLDNFEGYGPLTAPLNSALLGYREMSQDPRIANFNTVKNAVTRELTKAYQGGHITDSAVGEWQKSLNAAQTPEQLRTVVGQLNDLLSSKRLAMEEGYRQTMGKVQLPKDYSTVNERTGKIFEDVANWSAGAKPAARAPAPSTGPALKPGETTSINGVTIRRVN
jgi:hypothetical protein